MSDNPLFSVLIANYNNGRFLMEAVDSVKAQTYPNWEIVLVDDDSTDNSHELYKQLEQDDRIHIFYNKENKGCGYTKRRCVELAKGEICGFLDADDLLMPEALQIMSEGHVAHPDCSLFYSQYYVADNDLNIQGVSNHQRQISDGQTFLDLPFSGAVSHFASFKMANYRQTEGISPIQQKAVDIDLYLKMEEAGKLMFIPKPLYVYRMFTGSNISLGDYSPQASIWEIIARADACKRRNVELPVETTIQPVLKDRYDSGAIAVRNSKAYRIGFFILKPFKFFRNLLKK